MQCQLRPSFLSSGQQQWLLRKPGKSIGDLYFSPPTWKLLSHLFIWGFFQASAISIQMPGKGEECVSCKAWQAVWSFIGNVLTQLFLARYCWAALGYLMCGIDSLLPSCRLDLLGGAAAKREEHHPSLCLLQSLISGSSDDFSVLTWKNFATLWFLDPTDKVVGAPKPSQGVLWLCRAAVSDGLCPLPVTNTGSQPSEMHLWEHIFLHLHGAEVLVQPAQ